MSSYAIIGRPILGRDANATLVGWDEETFLNSVAVDGVGLFHDLPIRLGPGYEIEALTYRVGDRLRVTDEVTV